MSTLSPARSSAAAAADGPAVAHVAGVVGGPSYLPAGEGCYQCNELEGFDRVSDGVPLARRHQRRRRRDTQQLLATAAAAAASNHYSSQPPPVLVRTALSWCVCLCVFVCVCEGSADRAR